MYQRKSCAAPDKIRRVKHKGKNQSIMCSEFAICKHDEGISVYVKFHGLVLGNIMTLEILRFSENVLSVLLSLEVIENIHPSDKLIT